MKEGWIYLNNRRVFLQKLPDKTGEKVWHTFHEVDGWKKLNRWELVESIIADLTGTCQSLTEVCEDHNLDHPDELDFYELNEIDQNIFCCDFCGWWCDDSERNWYDGESYCDDDYREVRNEDDLDELLAS
jgi:hypothetical protein